MKRWLSFVITLSFFLMADNVLAVDWIYTVRKGETLWGLCKKYTKVANCWLRIGPYNQVEYPRSLAPGTRIRFPVEWLIEAPAPVTIVYLKGSATKVDTDGSVTPLNNGDTLTIGTSLKVDDDSLVVLGFADKSVMTVDAGSELTFDVLSSHGAEGMVDTRIHLKRGAVQTRVLKHTQENRFEVTTPSSVAAVRGTDFRVTSLVGKETATRNAVFDGAVAVSQGKQEKLLPRGKGILAKQGQSLSQVIDLLPPTQVLNQTGEGRIPFDLRWQALEGAESYRLEITSDNSKETLVKNLSEPHFTFDDQANGCYTFRISGVDSYSFQGMPAEFKSCLKSMLSAPADIRQQSMSKNTIQFNWSQVEQAIKYRVEISLFEDFNSIMMSKTVDDTYFELPLRYPDTRFVRIVAIDNNGDESIPSASSTLVKTQPPVEKNTLGSIFLIVVLFAIFV